MMVGVSCVSSNSTMGFPPENIEWQSVLDCLCSWRAAMRGVARAARNHVTLVRCPPAARASRSLLEVDP